MDTPEQIRTGSNLQPETTDMPQEGQLAGQDASGQEATASLSGASFTTYYIWRANGVQPNVNFTQASVNANSRVFVNISEYGANAQERFIGAARMAVYNIAPYNGGFRAWVDISWNSPLNIRFDVLIDP
ncbi:hypothetical protein [Janthinobacterium sp. PC23-8]|uniref:hypothetical protein n=1 Tax=Janthinobacterium sp. PC23-8 TaxID=2012679 RepID=UPI000B978270|nr:hypothetical protein [Janthinobacterium sp. PC23-8]OYO30118.1 hypothetical protein CD932_02445 [Janthinobacterium sp. PC23-8]